MGQLSYRRLHAESHRGTEQREADAELLCRSLHLAGPCHRRHRRNRQPPDRRMAAGVHSHLLQGHQRLSPRRRTGWFHTPDLYLDIQHYTYKPLHQRNAEAVQPRRRLRHIHPADRHHRVGAQLNHSPSELYSARPLQCHCHFPCRQLFALLQRPPMGLLPLAGTVVERRQGALPRRLASH